MNPLSLQRFRELAEVHGGDLARWPGTQRTDAEALLVHDAQARDALAQAAALDALLAGDTVAPPRPELRRAIVLAAQDRIGDVGFLRALWRELGGLRIAGPALAASMALGVAAATLVAPALETPTDEQAPGYAELALFEGAYEDYAL